MSEFTQETLRMRKYFSSAALCGLVAWILLNLVFNLVAQVNLKLLSQTSCLSPHNNACIIDVTYRLGTNRKQLIDNLWMGNQKGNHLVIKSVRVLNSFNYEMANIDLNRLTTISELLNVSRMPLIITTNSGAKQSSHIFPRVIDISLISLFITAMLSPIILLIVFVRYKMKNLFILPLLNLNNKLLSLNFFRFIAASIVVFFHFGGDLIRNSVSRVFICGPQMVTFFFVLSGFVMIIAHYNKQNEGAVAYYKLRLARLYPVYLVALLLQIRSNSSFFDVSLNTLLIQAFVPGRSLAINQPGWSLSAEAFFYLCFPLLLFVYRKRNILFNICTLLLFILLSIMMMYYVSNIFVSDNRIQFLEYFPLIHFASFVLGNMIGVIYLNRGKLKSTSVCVNSLLVGVSFILMVLDLNNGGFIKHLTSLIPDVIVNAPFFALFILCMAVCENSIFHLMIQNKICLRLGDLSYSIYILQFFVFNKLANIMLLLNSQWLQFVIPYILLLGLSLVTYKFIEVPCKKLILRACSNKTIRVVMP
ncbi:MAG: acyltransferase [Sphingobacteriaceae bacterium]|nr:acyltransferase [Sphingobacteriaceae bacterium]